LDDITLSIGNVPWEPADPATMTVLGPETNPAGEPFTLDILWHDIDSEEGDRLYGLIDVYADADYETEIGITQIDVKRGVDDVVKTADVETATVGDVITYSIEITNYATGPTEYAINDVLPEGVTYVPDSATGGAVYDPATNAITWTGTIEPAYYAYDWTTSAADPACTLAIEIDGNPADDYLDWKTTSYGFSTISSIYGDGLWYYTFETFPPFNYYGVDYVSMEFTDDARTGFDMDGYDYINQEFPDPTVPNNTMGLFWDDFVVQYDAATNKGVTLVGNGATYATIEYDDIYLYDYPDQTMDVEVGYFLQPDDTPGAYEIVYAYDNITPGFFDVASGTIGMENVDGTVGTTFSYNDADLFIENGSAICFDYVMVPPTHTITFQVVVNEDAVTGPLTNVALHSTDRLGTAEEAATAVVDLTIIKNIYLPIISR